MSLNHREIWPALLFRTLVILGLLTFATGGAYAAGVTGTLQGLGGNCLDVLDANPQAGAQVDNFTCNGTVAQVFNLNQLRT